MTHIVTNINTRALHTVCERRPAVPEEHVIALWLRELRPERRFGLRDGRQVRVLDAGVRNRHDGPDFLSATIVIDDTLLRGSIEVHTREGDWERHGHSGDIRYRDVVLHVCLYAERGGAERPPALILSTEMQAPLRPSWAAVRRTLHPFPCARPGRRPSPAHSAAMISLAAAERFAVKCARSARRHDELCEGMEAPAAWRQVMYEAFARAAGYGGNEQETEALARALPLREIACLDADARRNRFFLAAGLLQGADAPLFERHAWRNARVMPHNRAAHRLRWFASWCIQLEQPQWWRSCFALLRSGTLDSRAWMPLFRAAERGEIPGRDRVFEMLVNVLAPCVRSYAVQRGDAGLAQRAAVLYFSSAPAAQNRHTRALSRALERGCLDAEDQQGMTELHGNHCTQQRCHTCLCHANVLS